MFSTSTKYKLKIFIVYLVMLDAGSQEASSRGYPFQRTKYSSSRWGREKRINKKMLDELQVAKISLPQSKSYLALPDTEKLGHLVHSNWISPYILLPADSWKGGELRWIAQPSIKASVSPLRHGRLIRIRFNHSNKKPSRWHIFRLTLQVAWGNLRRCVRDAAHAKEWPSLPWQQGKKCTGHEIFSGNRRIVRVAKCTRISRNVWIHSRCL